MTAILTFYFASMFLFYVLVGYCIYRDWYGGADIPLFDILQGIAIGAVPLVNAVMVFAVCCDLWQRSLKHIKIKGRKR
jgi:hypothetical protein